ncbi:hypothetical protein D187_007513 [Cystobacter fuscus DSM 2262]|uniref:Uncharacterized protein n=1 Tax=Cystobacter fuscus (strain ATCC 25194 / DSM 2262 / NBRC 100088 / M29) TaxID=1242864 RepID=S9NZ93_CYSF2|nr:hypothetical protein D187_007513 [Cystobacter fuscus DSM 2262]
MLPQHELPEGVFLFAPSSVAQRRRKALIIRDRHENITNVSGHLFFKLIKPEERNPCI